METDAYIELAKKFILGFIRSYIKTRMDFLANPILWQHLCVAGEKLENVWPVCINTPRKIEKNIDFVLWQKKMKCQMMTCTFSLITLCVTQLKVYHMLSLIWILNPKIQLFFKFFFKFAILGWHLQPFEENMSTKCVCMCVCVLSIKLKGSS